MPIPEGTINLNQTFLVLLLVPSSAAGGDLSSEGNDSIYLKIKIVKK